MKKMNSFSVPLGLLDYINPIFYGITTYIIMKFMHTTMDAFWFFLFAIGAFLSLVFGLIIPTGKLLVGLGKIKFVMPVSLVFFVNLGLLLSGVSLFYYVYYPSFVILILLLLGILLSLSFLYFKTKKFNTIAVLLGAVGYFFIYLSLITLSIRNGSFISVLLYLCAIGLFLFLCRIGIKANLKNPRVHWVIELSNVTCQFLVMIGTIILFH